MPERFPCATKNPRGRGQSEKENKNVSTRSRFGNCLFFFFSPFSQRVWKDYLCAPDGFVRETPTRSHSIAGRRHPASQTPAGSHRPVPFQIPVLPSRPPGSARNPSPPRARGRRRDRRRRPRLPVPRHLSSSSEPVSFDAFSFRVVFLSSYEVPPFPSLIAAALRKP